MTEAYNIDCMEAMAQMKENEFDLAIVDPPYGIGENGSRNAGDRPTAKWKNPSSLIYRPFNDSLIPCKYYFMQLLRVSKNQIIWGGNHFTKHLPPKTGWIVWDKEVDIKERLSMAELAWSSFEIKCNIFKYLWAGFKKKHQVERFHPTQKPVDLYRWLLKNYAKEGDRILDTHLGSGSSRIAAHDMGFDFVGYEIDKDYYDAQELRFQNHIKQQSLFKPNEMY